MSMIQELTPANFNIVRGKVNNLGINIPGAVLVCFKCDCAKCQNFDPTFRQLASSDQRIMCANADVRIYRDIIGMSRETSTPIQGTPTLILYLQGRPHARYNGERTLQKLREFLSKTLNGGNSQQMQSSMMNPQMNQMQQGFMTPSPGHSGYNVQGGNQRIFVPEGIPSQVRTPSGMLQHVQESDNTLLSPETMIPYNAPWESEYNKIN